MKLALHRSLLFWSGLLVIAFICGNWWMSYDSYSYVNYQKFVGAQANGYVSFGQSGFYSITDAGHYRVKKPVYIREFAPVPFWARSKGSPPRLYTHSGLQRYETVLKEAYENSPLDAWAIFIPHWLLILAVSIAWTGLLIWRLRRRFRGSVNLPEEL